MTTVTTPNLNPDLAHETEFDLLALQPAKAIAKELKTSKLGSSICRDFLRINRSNKKFLTIMT